jgi:hypothetical protein
MSVGVYAKAVIGALVAGIGVLVTGLSTGDDGLTTAEVLVAVAAFLTGLLAVWATPNTVVEKPAESTE